jgi:hypothetical protein
VIDLDGKDGGTRLDFPRSQPECDFVDGLVDPDVSFGHDQDLQVRGQEGRVERWEERIVNGHLELQGEGAAVHPGSVLLRSG